MSLSRFSVNRPIFTIMAVLIVLILGGISLSRLPIDLMPDITYPVVSVFTTYENASPEIIEELVTRRIEQAVSGVPGVQDVISTSVEGVSIVRITFTWGTDVDAAANDVRDYLDRVIASLPEDAERPLLRKFDLAGFPILFLGVAGKFDPVQLYDTVDTDVRYRLERVPGVAAVNLRGGRQREIHVDLYPDKVKALGISFSEIVSRLRGENVTLPAGGIYRGNFEVTVRTQGEYVSLEQVQNTVIAVRNGVPVKLREIAAVEDSWQKVTQLVRVNGDPGILLLVNKQSGTNTVGVAKGVLREISRINEDMPQLHISPIVDTSKYIERSIVNVGSSAMYGGVLAVFILFFFLRNLRSTIIIATSIPISIIATFTLLYFCGFTLNIMTLGGLALGVGMLVDNSIVVLENIYRLRESGKTSHEAALEGSSEVTAAILASTLTTMAVFLPLIFVRGMAGVMFQQLAYVVSFSLLCSLVTSLTLVPMLAANILKIVGPGGRPGWREKIFTSTGKLFTYQEELYRDSLQSALRHKVVVIIAAILIFLGSLWLIRLVGVEFMPVTDESEVRISAELAVGSQLDLVDAKMREIEEIIAREVPERESILSNIGGTSWRPAGSHTGEVRLTLKPVLERSRSSEQIAAALRRSLSGIPGVTIRVRAGEGFFLLRMGTGGADKVELEVRGYDYAIGNALALRVKKLVEGVPGVTDAKTSSDAGTPEEVIYIDREKAADLTLTVSQIVGALETALSGTHAGNFRKSGKEYRILVKFQEAEKLSLREVLDITLVNAEGEAVVLGNVVDVYPRLGPVNIERKNQERTVTISANISGRDLGSILSDIREGLALIPKAKDFQILFGGDYEEQQRAFMELLLGFILSIVLVYMVMACQYESLRDPLVVMFSVPLAVIGVVLALILTDTPFSLPAFIGCIMLGGIVVNNAILLVDHTNLLRTRDGMPLEEAIVEAGRRRLRPILMTTLTTILGLIPLAIGSGEGGESQAPMARTVIGGLTSSTVITLLFIPTMYAFLAKAVVMRNREQGIGPKRNANSKI